MPKLSVHQQQQQQQDECDDGYKTVQCNRWMLMTRVNKNGNNFAWPTHGHGGEQKRRILCRTGTLGSALIPIDLHTVQPSPFPPRPHNLIRLSVGCEDLCDLIKDLDIAMKVATGRSREE
uniref:Cystathionine gamma-lyase n=1 Tax=Globodera rostochiensis TaxID=31243 RepID=A0A914I624_GLORO